jgi:hypothetical protein
MQSSTGKKSGTRREIRALRNEEGPCSLPWFVTIQQDLTRLTPKAGFISAGAIEREIGQVDHTQNGLGELA